MTEAETATATAATMTDMAVSLNNIAPYWFNLAMSARSSYRGQMKGPSIVF